MRNSNGTFTKGSPSEFMLNIGEIRVRTRHKRGNEKRAFIKVAHPNVWVLLSRKVWEDEHGAIPKGLLIHHKDGNKLNDSIDNLELVSKSKHLAIHRTEFKEKSIAAFIAARKSIRWSTKSATKKTGHPITWTENNMSLAIAEYASCKSMTKCSRLFGVPVSAIKKRLEETT